MPPFERRGGGGFGGQRGRGGFGGQRSGGGFRGGRGGRGGFRGGSDFRQGFDNGPPEKVVEYAEFTHKAQEDLVCKVFHPDLPFFNAPMFLENENKIGSVDEVFGTISEKYISIKLATGMVASSFIKGTKFFIDERKLIPLTRFTNPDQPKKGRGGGGRGGGRGRGRGGGGGRGFGRGGGGGRGFGRGGGGGRGFGRGGGGGGFGRGGGGGGFGRGGRSGGGGGFGRGGFRK